MIKYVYDLELKYYKNLERNLSLYNDQFVDNKSNGECYIYVYDSEKLIAGCYAERYWNWVFIEKIAFESEESFNILIDLLISENKGKAEGIHYETFNENLKRLFIKREFRSTCEMKDKPIGKISNVLLNQTFNTLESHHNYTCIIEDAPDDKHQKDLKTMIESINSSSNVRNQFDQIAFMAFDEETWIGGIYGYITNDYLHVNLLWIDKKYRRNGVAKKLMNLLHNAAVDRGCTNSFVETCSFHSKPFYEKMGYNVKCVLEEMPIGYKDFFLTKILD